MHKKMFSYQVPNHPKSIEYEDLKKRMEEANAHYSAVAASCSPRISELRQKLNISIYRIGVGHRLYSTLVTCYC